MELACVVGLAAALVGAPVFLLRGGRSLPTWGVTLAAVYGAAGAFFALEASRHGVIDDARLFRTAGFLWIGVLLAARWLMWRSLPSHGPRRIKLLSLLFLVPMWFVIDCGMEIVNRKLDASPAQVHRQVIWGKDFGKNPHAPGHYFFWVEWWSHPGKPIMVPRVDKATYDRAVAAKSVLAVASHPGALGYEWIESFALEE